MIQIEQLKMAMYRRGITLSDLATLMGVTDESSQQVLIGSRDLSPIELSRLCDGLNFGSSFFIHQKIDFLHESEVSFRKLASVSKKEKLSILAGGSIAIHLYQNITKGLNLPKPDLPDIESFTPPEFAAALTRKHWGAGQRPFGDIVKAMESFGIVMLSFHEDSGIDGFSLWNDGIPCIFVNTAKTSERSRFSIAHELGHLLLHKNGVSGRSTDEKDADIFASELLIPTEDLENNFYGDVSIHGLIALKQRWGVSLKALIYKLKEKGYIADHVAKNLFIQTNNKFGCQYEPEAIEPLKSYVFQTVLKKMWSQGQGKNQISTQLGLPVEDIESYSFGAVELNSKFKTLEKLPRSSSELTLVRM
jgi:Zn-dependent peptidase ImmA (M78 family)/transcriptional regulator with XRE-family HTH domain